MQAPPVLTAERIDAMLSIMAEVCLEGVVEAGQRQKTAEDFEAFERGGRTLQRACRNLRQTIAMKQRHDREQERQADDGRRRTEDARRDAQRARDEAVTIRRAQVRRHFDRLLWDEYEPDDVEDMLDVVHERLGDLILDDDFLEVPLDTLIQRLADEIGLGDAGDEPPDPPPATSPTQASGPQKSPRAARPRDGGDPSRPSAGPSDPPHGSPPARGRAGDRGDPRAGDRFLHEAPAPSDAIPAMDSDGPPPRPPDPLPPEPLSEPYIPPWERLGPGQRMPGGSGW